MCGRYVSATSPNDLVDYFGASAVTETLTEPNYNVAPSVSVPVVTNRDNERTLGLQRWGLIPSWAKSASVGYKMINARVETVVTKNAFRSSIRKRRCLVPADAFYEWTAIADPASKKPRKQPWCITRADGAPFSFAGLYGSWKDPEGDGSWITSFAVLTGPANQAMSTIHDRMPIMVAPSQWDAWLDPADHEAEQLLESLIAPPDDLLHIHAVSTAVNNSRSSGAALMDEVEPMTEASLLAEYQATQADEAAQGSLL